MLDKNRKIALNKCGEVVGILPDSWYNEKTAENNGPASRNSENMAMRIQKRAPPLLSLATQSAITNAIIVMIVVAPKKKNATRRLICVDPSLCSINIGRMPIEANISPLLMNIKLCNV